MNSKYLLTISDDVFIKVFIVIALVIFVFLVISLLLHDKKDKIAMKKFDSIANSVRIICIDYKNQRVKFFDKFDMANQHETTFQEFLEQFVQEERVRIEKWIDELTQSKKNVSDYLEVDVIIKKDKRSYYSFLQLQKIDKKKKLIHLESYIMKYLDVKHKTEKKKVSKISTTNIDQMFTIENIKNKNKGSFLFVAFRNNKIQDGDDDKVDSLFFTCIKNIIVPYLNANCSIADYSQSSFSIFYPGISSRRNLLRLMHSMSNAIAVYLRIHAYNEKYTYSITGSLITEDVASYKQLVRNTRSISISAMEHDNHVMIYDGNVASNSSVNSSMESEFNNLIEKKDFKIMFQPIVNVNNGHLLAYVSSIECSNTLFGNIQDLKEYAYKSGKGKDLFFMFNKKTLTRYKSENISDVKLIYHISVLEKDYVIKSLSHISGLDESKIVLAFDETEISEWLSEEQEIIDSLENLVKHGYKLALVIDQRELLLTNEIMDKFNYYILSGELTKSCKKGGKSILIMHSIIDALKGYKRDIIAYDLDTTNSIYLLNRMGIKYISSSLISQKDEMILPIEKKKMSKIMTFLNGKK